MQNTFKIQLFAIYIMKVTNKLVKIKDIRDKNKTVILKTKLPPRRHFFTYFHIYSIFRNQFVERNIYKL